MAKPSPLILCDAIPLSVVCTGSRAWPTRERVWRILDGLWQLTEGAVRIGVGDCPTGLDLAVAEWEAHNWPNGCGQIVTVYEADWDRYGNYAGPKRNREMVRTHQPDMVLAFFAMTEENKGTHNCVDEAVKWDPAVVIHMYEE